MKDHAVLMTDLEPGKTDISHNVYNLVDIIPNLLDDENLVTNFTPLPPISTTSGLICTHVNCTHCSEIDVQMSE